MTIPPFFSLSLCLYIYMYTPHIHTHTHARYTELLTSEHVATVSYFQPLFHSPLFLIAFLCPSCFQRPSESIISKGLGKHFLLFSRFTTNVNAVVFFLHPKKCTRDIFKVSFSYVRQRFENDKGNARLN